MKNPNRNVIVEYKNRRTRKNRNSLWGNLDLKSIARSVEEDNSVQSAPVIPPQPAPIDPDTSSLIVNATVSVPEFKALTEPAKVIKPEMPSGIPDELQEPPLSPKMAQIPTLSTIALPTNVRSTAQRRNTSLLVSKKRRVAKISVDYAVKDELSALEIENTALKHRLIVKLRAENNQMKRMLECLVERQRVVR
ncbi:hypothetical protein ACI0FS_23465 [Ochrobactrum quorumnocens]|uniref:hypothetical protein n=1 Tax=Ochrobactrum quorumnocens TaxID=271865 RepID=UPI0038526C77